MQLLIEENGKRAVTNLFDARSPRFPILNAGDSLPISVGVCDEIDFPFDSRLFTPQSLSGVTFRAALGVGFVVPVAGTFTLITNEDETTDPIGYNPSAFEIEAALNAVATYGVTVTGGDGFFFVTAKAAGVRGLLMADASQLVPVSVIDIARAVTGDVNTKDVQTVRIIQRAAALSTLDTASTAAGISIATVQTGAAGVNHQVRVSITGDVYRGTWLFNTATGQSRPIGHDDTPGLIRSALEATVGVGSGNVSVVQEDVGTWLITFIGDLEATAITGLDVDGTNLIALQRKSGALSLDQAAIDILLDGVTERVVSIEIEKQTGTDSPTKILNRNMLLVRPVIAPEMADEEADLNADAVLALRGITSFTGHVESALPFVATTGLTAGTGQAYSIRVDGQFIVVYLDSGAADPFDEGQVDPLDYDATTNSKHWSRGL